MTQEVLKLALEALEDACGECCNAEYKPCFQRKAITAIKKALAQEQEQEPLTENGMYRLGYHNGYGFGEAYGKANAPQRTWVGPEQEPVAWQFMKGSNFRKHRPDDFDDLASDGLPYWKPLYTTPQQRTWVGLTDEERQDIALEVPMDAVSITEAKLKEKNT